MWCMVLARSLAVSVVSCSDWLKLTTLHFPCKQQLQRTRYLSKKRILSPTFILINGIYSPLFALNIYQSFMIGSRLNFLNFWLVLSDSRNAVLKSNTLQTLFLTVSTCCFRFAEFQARSRTEVKDPRENPSRTLIIHVPNLEHHTIFFHHQFSFFSTTSTIRNSPGRDSVNKFSLGMFIFLRSWEWNIPL